MLVAFSIVGILIFYISSEDLCIKIYITSNTQVCCNLSALSVDFFQDIDCDFGISSSICYC